MKCPLTDELLLKIIDPVSWDEGDGEPHFVYEINSDLRDFRNVATTAYRMALEWCNKEFGGEGPSYSNSEYNAGRHDARCELREEILTKLREME